MSDHVAKARTEIAADPERVWQALTDPDQISEWMQGSQVTTTWEVGSPITWDGEYDGKTYQDKGEVLTYEEPRELSVTHYSPMMGQPDEPENYHTLVYTLSADAAGDDGSTTLELTQDGNESQEQAEQFSENWQSMLDALKAHVEG